MTLWTYKDVPYFLKPEAKNFNWRWVVDFGEGVHVAGLSPSKMEALERAFQMIDSMPGISKLEMPQRLQSSHRMIAGSIHLHNQMSKIARLREAVRVAEMAQHGNSSRAYKVPCGAESPV